MTDSLYPHKFPTFCAVLVGGFTFLQKPFRLLFDYACIHLISHNKTRWAAKSLEIPSARFLSALVAAWMSLPIQNKPKQAVRGTKAEAGRVEVLDVSGQSSQSPQRVGRTIDLTLFTTIRAIETIVVNLWRHQVRKSPKRPSTLSSFLSSHTDELLFAVSCNSIMWNWFYHPETLPRAYNKWIASAAQVDLRLIKLLRLAKSGDFVYGEDKGPEARQLEGMCKDYSWPIEWGDPQKTCPVPCEMVHMGTGPNCHWHAAVRFTRAFKFAMATNFPLQLVARAISKRRLSTRDIAGITKDSARSSAFLGAFVTLMYYGICLSRTQLGPKLFDEKTVSRQDWDSGLCVRAACLLCGWSILIEKERRRGELAMFVAPRAAATFLPRSYDRKFFWRERAAFSVSTALLFTLAQEDRGMVRGVLGRLLNGILA